MRVQLTFRSGAQIVVDVEKLQVTHDGPAKAISAVQWNDAATGNRLLGLVPSDVVAVVELTVQPPDGPHLHGPGHAVRHDGMTCEQYAATETG